MKAIKYILLFSYLLIITGVFGKTLLIFPRASIMLLLGLNLFLSFGVIYGIITLVKQQNRQEAAMIAVSMILSLGITFKFMYWPGASIMIIIGTPVQLFGSIGILAYSSSKKIKITQAILFLSIGISSLFFCFKVMRWPGSTFLFILSSTLRS